MLITRRVEFSASHTLYNPGLTGVENAALYGAEANPNGHGHNFSLEVTLAGDPDPVTGMIVDLKWVKQILEQEVVEPLDHRHLNREVPPFDRIVPTTENLAVEIWRRLKPRFDGTPARLHNVRIFETDDLYADYCGE